ncbi:hypothetical protein Nepgr_015455 [Nepenthes gracilis]|uniref:Nitrate regulatory gene2 protein-like n=1 Tax=Nepenthes gracilis TaxID=150966 RepID=A0AAD3SMX4_NEPGR|nr:hypothetical protein Nepgr_015455 [Nepenthes gracilis]
MGCNTSKLDEEEAVQLCKDRKSFIKQAVEQRMRFASGHLAYIQSLKRVSAALRNYIEGDEPREFLIDSYITPPFTPIKKSSPQFITISPKCFSATPVESEGKSSAKICYYRPGGTPSYSVEERPQSPETVPIETYYSPMPHQHNYEVDGFFTMQNPAFYPYSPNNRPTIPPPSPQASQWDFFWNPFSSLDYYGYPMGSSLDRSAIEDEIAGLRQVREEEGIPDLEEETEHEELDPRAQMDEERVKNVPNYAREEVVVEDVDDDDDDDDDEMESGDEREEHRTNTLQSSHVACESIGLSQAGQVEVSRQETMVSQQESKEETTPGFTVYVNQRPTSMDEVIRDLEKQFTIICNSATEVSAMLEASRAWYSSSSNEHTAMKMLNPVTLFRSASSRSSSSRFFGNSSGSRDEGYESSSDFSEEASMQLSGSHQTTVGKLYVWEKRLYEEVRSGERIRRAYEKKCMQLRSQDVKGDDPSSVDKTRAAIRSLHTQIKVSIRSIEAVSKRIETLRDEELHPRLLELVQGLARMWKVMAECHQTQKRTLDEAKFLLAGTPSKHNKAKQHTAFSATDPHRLSRSAATLETELRNWKACFESWITSQRSYVHALTSWLFRCMGCEPDASKLPFSPRRSAAAPPIFGICIQWSRFLDKISEVPVLDGLDFFAAGMGSIYAQLLKGDSHRVHGGPKRFSAGPSGDPGGNMEVVEFGQVEETMTPQKMAEVAIRVLCAGMSVAMSSLSEFAVGSAEGYAELVNQWENVKWPPVAISDMEGM